MEHEKTTVNVPTDSKGMANVIISHLDAPAHTFEPRPKQINIKGTLQVVAEFVQKRHIDVPEHQSRLEVSRDSGTITLHLRDQDPFTSGIVKGTLEASRIFEEFGINTRQLRTPLEMAHFFKMNRYYFTDPNENMKLVSALSSFEASIDSRIVREKKENGSHIDNYSAVVHSNIPPGFRISMPIFKGATSETFEVEFLANINGREISLALVSPGANQAIQQTTNDAIDDQLLVINESMPDLAILEV